MQPIAAPAPAFAVADGEQDRGDSDLTARMARLSQKSGGAALAMPLPHQPQQQQQQYQQQPPQQYQQYQPPPEQQQQPTQSTVAVAQVMVRKEAGK